MKNIIGLKRKTLKLKFVSPETNLKKNDFIFVTFLSYNMYLIYRMISNINDNIDEDILDDEDKVYDFIHEYIDNYVSKNSFELNMEVVNKIFGSVFKAIKSYKNEYGDYPDDENEYKFYAILAFHGFRSNIRFEKGIIVSDLDS